MEIVVDKLVFPVADWLARNTGKIFAEIWVVVSTTLIFVMIVSILVVAVISPFYLLVHYVLR